MLTPEFTGTVAGLGGRRIGKWIMIEGSSALIKSFRG